MVLPTAALVAGSLLLGLLAGPLYDLSTRAAEDLDDPQAYVTAVLGPGGGVAADGSSAPDDGGGG
jgi:multicomponent Na+:H+ antiporter subunit D